MFLRLFGAKNHVGQKSISVAATADRNHYGYPDNRIDRDLAGEWVRQESYIEG